jgi:hypothetical protein
MLVEDGLVEATSDLEKNLDEVKAQSVTVTVSQAEPMQ